MLLQNQSLTTHLPLPSFFLPKPTTTKSQQFTPLKQQNPLPQFSLKCSLSTVSAETPTHVVGSSNDKPFPAEVSRTIMELSSVGTLSTLTPDGWPWSVGVRFAVDDDGTPILCLSDSFRQFSVDRRSSLHVQLVQSGMRTRQCTIQGILDKPEDTNVLKLVHSMWKKRFGEEVKDELIYVVAMERVLQMEDFMEDGVWVSSSDYKNASPDPLRDFAEAFANEINDKNMEDVSRFCNVYVDLDFQVSEAKMIWVDRLGFDIRLWSPQKGTFDVRIPFPREVIDVKGAKSSFNGMSQLAWEVEKNYQSLNFKKVKQLKQITQGIVTS
ncbi:GLUTAMYL-TRNA REDUCTASE-BINDING PROTEIN CHLOROPLASTIC [Salix viminalis]|uniref:GLUTAMYL-TRNA REDUCTASE-BINDING PROTEIN CHLOROPLASTIC n=1 Tax=Salix viminalis TaxID=40686 RepID=A0A9Q0TY96_SALVM|nr:GLUTAMYL-TRNA REDUCTASE-BINDING PROTEIN CHLOROPLASTIC [Salix viminalis]